MNDVKGSVKQEMAEARGLYSQEKDPTTGLTKNQRAVLQGFKDRKTQMQIAEELGISRQRVHQITKDLKDKGYQVNNDK